MESQQLSWAQRVEVSRESLESLSLKDRNQEYDRDPSSTVLLQDANESPPSEADVSSPQVNQTTEKDISVVESEGVASAQPYPPVVNVLMSGGRTLTVHALTNGVRAVLECKFNEFKKPVAFTVMTAHYYFRIFCAGSQWYDMFVEGLQRLAVTDLFFVRRVTLNCFEPLLANTGLSGSIKIHLLQDERKTGLSEENKKYSRNNNKQCCRACQKSYCDFQKAADAIDKLVSRPTEDFYHFRGS